MSFEVDFFSSTMMERLRKATLSSEAIAKAVGLKAGIPLYVVDATAGFGVDGYMLAYLGARVHMIERSDAMAKRLAAGFASARQSAHFAKLPFTWEHADARDVLKQTGPTERPDVVYLDPMYPLRKKSALNKAKMRWLLAHVGSDMDADELFTIALVVARNKVVVKRPVKAAYLKGQAPSYSIKGRACRFDVYPVN